MNHILKKVIKCVVSIFCVFGMISTTGKSIKAEGEETSTVSAPTGIYIDQINGDDANDGFTKSTAVKTIEKANELAEENALKDIFLSSFYTVTGSEEWDLGGKTIHRYGLGGYMIILKDSNASLTLGNVVIDGKEYTVDAEHAAETDSIIKAANGGTILLKSGSILENNKAAQFGSGIIANNGVNITMEDGAIIRNNTNTNYELGGGILIGNGSTFTMNGGEISGNTANGGGGVAIIGSSMIMNGGKISGNSCYRTSGQGSYGAGIYVADYANSSGGDTLFTPAPASFEMNGGTISGNNALDYGGGILTFPQRSKKVTITINDGLITENSSSKGSGGAIAAFFAVTTLNVKGGTITNNNAINGGGGIFLYQTNDVTVSDGIISENKANFGGGICLNTNDTYARQTGGSIENNIANAGGGVFGGNYTMVGGIIKDNNNSLTIDERKNTKGDGVYVGNAFNLGDNAVIATNNDVYLVQGTSIPKQGRYINMITPYTGTDKENPIEITSEDVTIEDTAIGTQLVYYTNDAGSENAAEKADENKIFVPSWKMREGLAIGQSKENGNTNWLTYVPSVTIHYKWISTDNPSDVLPPEDEHIRKGTEYTSQKQEDTAENYIFEGWFIDEDCSNKYIDGTTLNTDITLYGKWTAVYGNLTVNKKVAGTDGDKNQEFNFKVTLSKPVNGTYGDMTFTDGVANFTLKHDESKKGVNLPANISYTVVEDDYSKDGYTTTSVNSTGTITKDKTTEVSFTNTKNKKEVKEDKVENNKPTITNVTTNYQLIQTDTRN